MHVTARGGASRRPFLALLALPALLLLALTAPAMAAQPPFTGGPIATDCPTAIANDHSVNAMRFTASGLAPSTTYYVKLRFSPNTTPAGSDNRSFTWNPGTQAWVQERTDDWTAFPSITTDASGVWAGTGNSDWFYVKFGDTTMTGAYYLLVSLSTGVQGNTANSATPIAVTVMDMATAGYWVHAGPASGAAGKRVDVVAHADGANANAAPLSLIRAEPNLCDDDGNGIVDDEQPGLVQAGGFRLAAPAGQIVDARVQKTVWPAGSLGITSLTPDVDIALGGDDITPPSAPASLSVAAGVAATGLSWGAATDDTGVAGYDIYRWSDADGGAGYTAAPTPIATVAGTTLTYWDASVALGADYHYIIRARDAATNVGPRSAQGDVTPPGAVTGLGATAGDGVVDLAWTNPADADLAGVRIVRTTAAAASLPTHGAAVYDGAGDSTSDATVVNGTAYFYTAFSYDTDGAYSAGVSVEAAPHAPWSTALTLQASAAVVKWNVPVSFSGALALTAGLTPVEGKQVQLQRSYNGLDGWTAVGSPLDPVTANQYATSVVPARSTFYRLSFAGDGDCAASVSNVVKVTPAVKLGTPVAPSTVRRAKAFAVYGSLVPKHASGATNVKVKCYRKSSTGAWVLRKTVTAKNTNYGTSTRYKASISLPTAGSWKLVASYATTAKYAAATSGARFVKAK
jgi:hypothetical protein